MSGGGLDMNPTHQIWKSFSARITIQFFTAIAWPRAKFKDTGADDGRRLDWAGRKMSKTMNVASDDERCIFVEGPGRPSAEFYGQWLLAAGKADALWKKAKEEPRFEKQLERVPNYYFPAFGMTAIRLVSQLANNYFSAIVRLDSKDKEEELLRWFLIMRLMDFFSFPDTRTK
jgi:hypothetical protein